MSDKGSGFIAEIWSARLIEGLSKESVFSRAAYPPLSWKRRLLNRVRSTIYDFRVRLAKVIKPHDREDYE